MRGGAPRAERRDGSRKDMGVGSGRTMSAAATRASSSIRSMSLLWNSPMTTPRRTGASDSSPTWWTAVASHLSASSPWCAKTTTSSVSWTLPGEWCLYSLGSFAFSSFFADFSAVATTDRRAGLAPRARGCERRGRGEVSGVPEARRIRSVRKKREGGYNEERATRAMVATNRRALTLDAPRARRKSPRRTREGSRWQTSVERGEGRAFGCARARLSGRRAPAPATLLSQ